MRQPKGNLFQWRAFCRKLQSRGVARSNVTRAKKKKKTVITGIYKGGISNAAGNFCSLLKCWVNYNLKKTIIKDCIKNGQLITYMPCSRYEYFQFDDGLELLSYVT